MIPARQLLAGATLMELAPASIDAGTRIGFLHEDKAAALGRLMAVDGQRDPIKVTANPRNPDQPWRLVTGMHRLEGARIECIPVFAIEVSGAPEDLADLEASENLHRRPLMPLERAKFVAALVAAAQERLARVHGDLKQQQLAVMARWARVKAGEIRAEQALQEETNDTADKMSAVYGWQESAADAFGLDPRSIRRALRLHRLIILPFADLVEPLSAHPVVGDVESQLKQIADIAEEATRRRVIQELLADDELSVEGAKATLGIGIAPGAPALHAFQKHYDAITGGWGRLSVGERNRFLPQIAGLLTPGMKRELRDMLDAELSGQGEPPRSNRNQTRSEEPSR